MFGDGIVGGLEEFADAVEIAGVERVPESVKFGVAGALIVSCTFVVRVSAPLVLALVSWLSLAGGVQAQDREEAQPLSLAPAVERALADPLTPPDERRAMLIFHGQWDRLEQPTPTEKARIALASGDWSNELLSDPATPSLLRAQAALLRGEPHLALESVDAGQDSIQAQALRAEALELMGRLPEAVAILQTLAEMLEKSPPQAPGDLVACTRAMVHLARWMMAALTLCVALAGRAPAAGAHSRNNHTHAMSPCRRSITPSPAGRALSRFLRSGGVRFRRFLPG